MKRVVKYVILFLLICIPLGIKAENKKYATDKAHILSEEVENYIIQYSDFLHKAKKIDYYVVTVNNLEGKTIEEYADEVYRSFKMKQKGLLILVSKEDRKIRIISGKMLSQFIDGELIDEYIDTYFIPYMEREKWNEGILNGYKALYKRICEEYGIDASEMEVIDELDFLTKYKTPLIFGTIWLTIMCAGYYTSYYKKIKRRKEYEISKGETLLFGLALVVNVILITFSYILEPVYLVFVIAFEGVTIYSGMSSKKVIIPEKVLEQQEVKQAPRPIQQKPIHQKPMKVKKQHIKMNEYKKHRIEQKRKQENKKYKPIKKNNNISFK